MRKRDHKKALRKKLAKRPTELNELVMQLLKNFKIKGELLLNHYLLFRHTITQ